MPEQLGFNPEEQSEREDRAETASHILAVLSEKMKSGEFFDELEKQYESYGDDLNLTFEKLGMRPPDNQADKLILAKVFFDKLFEGQLGRKTSDFIYGESGQHHPQVGLNLLLSDKIKPFFDSEGSQVSFNDYLQDHYRDLIGAGLSIEIKFDEVGNVFDQRVPNGEKRDVFRNLYGNSIPAPLLHLKYGERSVIIPIAVNWRGDDHSALASYEWREGLTGGNDHVIFTITPAHAGKERGLLQFSSTLLHEVDHAIFDFLRTKKTRDLGKSVSSINEEIEQLKKTLPSAKSEEEINRINGKIRNLLHQQDSLKSQVVDTELLSSASESMTFEGLSKTSEDRFRHNQIQGLAKSLPQNSTEVSNLGEFWLTAEKRGRYLELSYIKYSLGYEIIKALRESGADQDRLYSADALRGIFDNIENIHAAIAGFVKYYRKHGSGEGDNSDIISRIRGGLGSLANAFILGARSTELFHETEKYTDGLSPEEALSELERYAKDDKLAADILEKYEGDWNNLLFSFLLKRKINAELAPVWEKILAA